MVFDKVQDDGETHPRPRFRIWRKPLAFVDTVAVNPA